jgi:hypothetical protein
MYCRLSAWNKASVVAVVAAFAVASGAWFSTARTQRAAENFLRDSLAIRPGSSTWEQVNGLANKYHGRVSNLGCTYHKCDLFVDFENRWLAFFHLAPRTDLSCSLFVEEGTLLEKEYLLASGKGGVAFTASVSETMHAPRSIPAPFFVAHRWSGRPWRVWVNLTPQASDDQRRIAYGLNLRCLSRVRGCEDASQLLPTIKWDRDSGD